MASDLIIRVGADFRRFQEGLDSGLKGLKRFGFQAERIGSDLTTRLSLPLGAVGVAAVRTFASFDRLEKGLSAVTGSAKEGAKQFNEYINLVKDTQTTLSLPGAVSAALRFQAVGLSAEDAQRTIRQLGIAATVTGSSMDDVNGVTRQFTQILAKGKIEQEDFNSILERLPALAEIIKQEFGASTAEQVRATGVSMEEFVLRTVAAAEQSEVFQNVQGGLAKSFESFGIELQIAGRELGKTIAETLNLEEAMIKLSAFVSRAVNAFSNLNPVVQKAIVFFGVFATAVGPVTFALGSLAKTLPLLSSGFKLLLVPGAALLRPFGSLANKVGLLSTAFNASAGSVGRALPLYRALGKNTTEFISIFSKIGGTANKLRFVFGLLATSAGPAIAALFSPITLVVGGVTLLGAAIVKAYNKSETFRKVLSPITSGLSALAGVASSLAGGAIDKLSGAFSFLGDAFDVVLASVAALVAGLVGGLGRGFAFIRQQLTALVQLATGDFKGALKTFGNSFVTLIDGVAKDVAGTFTETLREDLRASQQLLADPFGQVGAPKVDPIEIPIGVIAPDRIDTPEPPKSPVDEKAVDFLNKYQAALAVVANKAAVLGEAFNETSAKGELLASSLESALDEGFRPTSQVVQTIKNDLLDFRSGLGETAVAALETDIAGNLRMGEASTAITAAGLSIDALNGKIDELKVNAPNANLFLDLQESFALIDEKVLVLGDSFGSLQEKINLTKEALLQAFGEDNTIQIELLREQLAGLEGQQLSLNETQASLAESMRLVGEVSASAFDSVANSLKEGATEAQAFTRAFVSSIRQAIAAEIKLGVAAAARKALTGVPFPFNVAAAAGAGAAASLLFNGLLNKIGIPALAEGGFVNSPTLALIGEAGPEVVVPLDRLKEFKNNNGGGGFVTGTLRAQGSELIAVIESARSDQYLNR